MQSNAFEDLQMSPVPDSVPLENNQTIEVAPMVEDSIGASEITLRGDRARAEAFYQEDVNLLGDEEESHNPQGSSPTRLEAPGTSLPSKPSDSQDCILEGQQTTVGSNDAPGSPCDAVPDTVTFDSRNPSELFTFLKQLPMDVALKNGTSDVLSFLRNIPKDLLEKALSPEDHEGTHFGSKNDWKRHESSQHFQLESWNCDMPGCDKVLPHRELFRSHLLNHHKLTDGKEVENKLEKCRLGRHCDPRFWCGFCDKFVEVKGEVVNSWTKRCDHIDNHLFGKEGMEKKAMSEWRYLEDKLAEEEREGAALERPSEPSKKRKAAEDLDTRPAKRKHYRWRCCHCLHMESLSTSTSCQESHCQHQRCDNCHVEVTFVPNEDAEMVDQEAEEVDED
ncbi:hypothetical protein A9Z42_0024250 [Trichoderma parareesei]|uniref:C2H2-type domain-containing protein n=1 Tax=Trichoderma parareesei TaxID=858221 RepID=A0A2H2ZPU2_TRIPA|nr:hypothetical protein A9Z42_0024250 [Trichoderma parareesei]